MIYEINHEGDLILVIASARMMYEIALLKGLQWANNVNKNEVSIRRFIEVSRLKYKKVILLDDPTKLAYASMPMERRNTIKMLGFKAVLSDPPLKSHWELKY